MIYKNPIIMGFNPDPSICRVGSDYYLVTSSFEYFPGIPIYHSNDLINWTMINYCISNPQQLDFKSFGNSGGIWAPTIRYNNGRFYVTATVDKLGNMITQSNLGRETFLTPIQYKDDWFYADGDYIVIQKCAEDFSQIIYKTKTKSSTFKFQINADKEYYYFYCAENNKPMQEICKASTHFLCVEMPSRCFTGTIIGVYTIGDMAEFSYFEMN